MASSFSPTQSQIKTRRRAAWAILFLMTITAAAVVLVPVFLIMPFRSQSVRGMEISYLMRRWSPSLTLVAAVTSLALLIWLWRGTRWWRKCLLVTGLVLTFGLTWLARQNHFEWMFNPLANAKYTKAGDVEFASDDDRVMAIEIEGEAVAYPIRLMAYHHIVSDTVGGIHVIATY